MNFFVTDQGQSRCLFCGSHGDLVFFEIEFPAGERPSLETLTAQLGPYLAQVVEADGPKIIVCACRAHVRRMQCLKFVPGNEMAETLSRFRDEIQNERLPVYPLTEEGYWW